MKIGEILHFVQDDIQRRGCGFYVILSAAKNLSKFYSTVTLFARLRG